MTTPAATGTLRELLGEGAEGLVSSGATRGVCVLLFSSVREEVEILHRSGLALEVCTALSDSRGRELLSWARRSPRAHLLRREGVAGRAPALKSAMEGDELGALALFPVVDEDSVLGYVVLGLAPLPRGLPLAEELERGAWERVGLALRRQSLDIGNAVLREILDLRRRGLARGTRALLVLDQEDRVLFSHGTSRIFPAWGRGEVVGQLLRSLPGGKVLGSVEASPGHHLAWRTRAVPGTGSAAGVALAATVLPLPGGRGPSPILVLIRDADVQDGSWCAGETGLLLELALRVNRVARAGHGPASLETEAAMREACRLTADALEVVDREDAEEAIDLSALLREILIRLEPKMRDDRVQVLPFLAAELPVIRGNRRSLETAFWSLVRRSWASLLPRGGTITLRTWEEAGSVWCTVSDDGPGIGGDEVLERLALEPLLEGGGSGEVPEARVDLARELIAAGGGAFHLESRPRLWTRYTAVFPAERVVRVAPSTVHPGLPPAVEVKRNGNGHLEVLVVDDNEMVRTVLRKYLERKGHAVTEAMDGGVALDMVAERSFDRIMVDIDMPGTTGVEFFERLASVAPGLRDRTIFMTGGFQESDTERYIEQTGRPHVHKPFDLGAIGQILRM